jgi:hypothetical protein
MNAPPPISPAPPVITQHSPKPSFAKQASTCSIAAPLIAVAVNIFSRQAVQENRLGMVIVGCTAVLLILAGFIRA